MKQWRLLITRPAADSAVLAELLAEQHIYSSSLPLLEIQALPETPAQRSLMFNLDQYCAVIVVSKPAATLGLQRLDQYWPQPLAEQHWFSVGAGTGRILADYGLSVSWPEQGDDSEALLALPQFIDSLKTYNPRVLIMRADVGRNFLAEQLKQRGVQVDFLPLYRRSLPVYPSGTLVARIQQQQLNGLVVSSEQGLRHLIELAGDAWPQLASLALFVPSPRVAQIAQELGAEHVIDCRGASNSALLKALAAHAAPTA
ncbi:MAG: uroporphyrinogen-III synthase [Pseudomonas sp.]|nr:uroporphyrinogen-III synthase [Pseudomonas sp.]MDD2223235.1 uroporphyrinogen-III synthase [Pseudomonas sp.]MDY0413839.1 uroporphyrinogen-III synthase [Pseudomonas sp.]NLO52969.1 uroporphyrinogen-III synthase [Gammaproteobacteria bacterium]